MKVDEIKFAVREGKHWYTNKVVFEKPVTTKKEVRKATKIITENIIEVLTYEE